jgi:hypothetical protein
VCVVAIVCFTRPCTRRYRSNDSRPLVRNVVLDYLFLDSRMQWMMPPNTRNR